MATSPTTCEYPDDRPLGLTLIGGSRTIDTAAGNVTIAGGIGQSGGGFGITKTGPGTLVLSGADTYSGGTTVLAGVLRIENADSLPDGSSLTVGAGAGAAFDGRGAAVETSASSMAAAAVSSAGVSPAPAARTVVSQMYAAHSVCRNQRHTECAAYVNHAQAHDAALLSLNTRPAVEEGKAAAWWNLNNSPSERKHHSTASAVDAVMALMRSTT